MADAGVRLGRGRCSRLRRKAYGFERAKPRGLLPGALLSVLVGESNSDRSDMLLGWLGVPIPMLTEERRKEFVKKLHHVAEEHRVGLRNVRRDANEQSKKLLKDKLISEDDERRALEEIQKLTDGYMQKLEAAAKAKEKDIMEVK